MIKGKHIKPEIDVDESLEPGRTIQAPVDSKTKAYMIALAKANNRSVGSIIRAAIKAQVDSDWKDVPYITVSPQKF